MAPPTEIFHPSTLPYHSQISTSSQQGQGKKRKGFDGDLKACGLKALVQYKCEVERPMERGGPVICWEVERLFRRCRDRNGVFTVETTAWEGSDRVDGNVKEKKKGLK